MDLIWASIQHTGNNLKNITTYLCEGHFNATIENDFIHLSFKVRTYHVKTLKLRQGL